MMYGGKDATEKAVVGFSEDIVTEILLRLPVKFLLIFKTVCRSWYSIINSTIFIREHLKRAHAARYNQHTNFLGILDACSPCVLLKEDFDGVMLAKKFDFRTNNVAGLEENKSIWARNSCDGLICFQMEHGDVVVIWNPSLPTEYKVINTSCFNDGVCSIVYDPCTDDYKIVSVPYRSVGNDPCAYISVQLFSLKRDSWRTLRITKTMDYEIENTKMIYAKNGLHWLAKGDYKIEGETTLFIAYFDLVEESLDYLNLPYPTNTDRVLIPLNYKESLGIAGFDLVEVSIWVLQEYCGMKSSWTKILKISCSYYWLMDCCFTLKGELLICNENGFAIVDAKDGSLKDVVCEGEDIDYLYQKYYLPIFCSPCVFTSPYVESLVSPIRLE